MFFPLGAPILALGLIAAEVSGVEVGRRLGYLVGVSLLGLADDLLGEGGPRGLRGHARPWPRGGHRPAPSRRSGRSPWRRGPRRGMGCLTCSRWASWRSRRTLPTWSTCARAGSEKAAALTLGALCAIAGSLAPVSAAWPFAPAAAAGVLLTLRERAMLGDSGASLIGAVAGIGCVSALGVAGTAVALSALIAISLYGEFHSIAAMIERVPLLQRLDSLGRSN